MTAARMTGIRACVFDAYGTLFDVHSAVGRLRAQIGAEADALSELWRTKQLEYSWLRALMGRHADFWLVTGDALDYALARIGVDPGLRAPLLKAYLTLDAYPEVPACSAACARAGSRPRSCRTASPRCSPPASAAPGSTACSTPSSRSRRSASSSRSRGSTSWRSTGSTCPPGQIAFQSSNAWDVHGAACFGLRPVWINRFGAPPERLPGAAEHELRDLAGLPALLGL